MPSSQLHYLPLTPTFFSILVGVLVALVVLIQLGILRYAYTRIGIGSSAALLLLFGSLLGSYVNIPVAALPEQQIMSGREITYFGMHYVVPVVVDWPGTVIAVNVGGALIPAWCPSICCSKIGCGARAFSPPPASPRCAIILADPVPGVGIALPLLVPALTTAVVALLLSRRYSAPLAYISGSLGTLIGADLLNLDKLQGLGTPIASIGGAGTFDGIFLTGILAVLLAGLSPAARQRKPGSCGASDEPAISQRRRRGTTCRDKRSGGERLTQAGGRISIALPYSPALE